MIVLRGIPLAQSPDEFRDRAPFLSDLKSLKASEHQKLAGNSQSLPVFGSMFVLALMSVKRATVSDNSSCPSAAVSAT